MAKEQIEYAFGPENDPKSEKLKITILEIERTSVV